jgi:hypothetical protein
MFRREITSFILLSCLLFTSLPFPLLAQVTKESKLDNALAGLQLAAASGKVNADVLKIFNKTHEAALKQRGLDQKFLKLQTMIEKFKDCAGLNIGADLSGVFANTLFSRISTCEKDGKVGTEEIDRLLGNVDKVINDIDDLKLDDKKENGLQELADRIYLEQRKMYVGTAYLAYNKYRKPGTSLEDFLKYWQNQVPKNLMLSAHEMETGIVAAPVHRLLEADKAWQAEFEKKSEKQTSQGFQIEKNLEALTAQGTKELRDINDKYLALNKVEEDRASFDIQIARLHQLVEPYKESQGLTAFSRAVEDPVDQGFMNYLATSKPLELAPQLDLKKNSEELARARREAEVTYKLFQSNSMLTDYVRKLEHVFGKKGIELQVVNDVVAHDLGGVITFNSPQTLSPYQFLEGYGVSDDNRGKFEYQLNNEIFNTVNETKEKQPTVMVHKMKLSELIQLHNKMMNESAITKEIQAIDLKLGSEWLDHYSSLQDSRAAARRSDTALLVRGANAGRYTGGYLPATTMQFESSAGTRQLSLDRGLSSKDQDLLQGEANKMLDSFFEESRKLTEIIDEKYNSLSAEDYLKQAISYHPALVNKIVAENPDYASTLCILAKKHSVDQGNKEEMDKLVATVGAIVGAGAIFATAGLATPIVVGVGAGSAAYGFARYRTLANEAEFASASLGATGQVKGREGAAGNEEVAKIQAQALANFQAAALDGILMPLEIRKLAAVLPSLGKGGDTWRILAESKDHVKQFAQSLKSSTPYTKLAKDRLETEIKDAGKGVIKKDEEELLE